MLTLQVVCLILELTPSLPTYPFHFVLPKLLNIADAFKNICDVVDSSFLNIELPGSFIDLDRLIRSLTDHLDKSLSEFTQSIAFCVDLTRERRIETMGMAWLLIRIR